jgi:hypothetical protein
MPRTPRLLESLDLAKTNLIKGSFETNKNQRNFRELDSYGKISCSPLKKGIGLPNSYGIGYSIVILEEN